MRTIIAKYACKCDTCGQPIFKGDLIVWSKASRHTAHARCEESASKSVREDEAVSAYVSAGLGEDNY